MSALLIVRVQHHHPQYHGRCADERAQWPPHPFRMFQALASAASIGGVMPPAAADAMRWLETLPPPMVACIEGRRDKTEWITYAPNNNDWDGKSNLAEMKRDHCEVHAPTSFAEPPVTLFAWTLPNELGGHAAHLATLSDVANMVDRVGTQMDGAWANASVMPKNDFISEAGRVGLQVMRPAPHGASFGKRMGVPYAGCLRDLEAKRRATTFMGPKMVSYNAPIEWRAYAMLRPDERRLAIPWADAPLAILGVKERLAKTLGEQEAQEMSVMPLPTVGARGDLRIRRFALIRKDGEASWDDADSALHGNDERMGIVVPEKSGGFMKRHYVEKSSSWQSVTPVFIQSAPRPPRNAANADAVRNAYWKAESHVRKQLISSGVDISIIKQVIVNANGFNENDIMEFGRRSLSLLRAGRSRRCLWHVRVELESPVKGPLTCGHMPSLGFGVMSRAV